MATRNIVESDLSGKADAATITFGLGGTWYEIDLTSDEEEVLASALKTYIKAGRKAAAKKPEKARQVPDTTVEEREEIRDWAKKEGIKVAERGRIPKKVMADYEAAHADKGGKKAAQPGKGRKK